MANLSVGYDAAGTPKTYTTVASAFAAAASDGSDNLQIYYSDTSGSRYWSEGISTSTTKQVGVEGMLDSQQVTFVYRARNSWYSLSGDLSGNTNISVLKNVTAVQTTDATLFKINESGGASAGFEVRNCRFIGSGQTMHFNGMTGGTYKVVNNLIAYGGAYGIDVRATGVTVAYNTVVGCNDGIYLGNVAVTAENNLCTHNASSDFGGIASATGNNNASGDATAANGNWSSGSNNQTAVTDADISPMLDNANGFYPFDWRVFTDSGLIGDGVAVAGETLDIDGQTRANPPAIGCSDGITFSEGGGGFVQSGSGRFGVREV